MTEQFVLFDVAGPRSRATASVTLGSLIRGRHDAIVVRAGSMRRSMSQHILSRIRHCSQGHLIPEVLGGPHVTFKFIGISIRCMTQEPPHTNHDALPEAPLSASCQPQHLLPPLKLGGVLFPVLRVESPCPRRRSGRNRRLSHPPPSHPVRPSPPFRSPDVCAGAVCRLNGGGAYPLGATFWGSCGFKNAVKNPFFPEPAPGVGI